MKPSKILKKLDKDGFLSCSKCANFKTQKGCSDCHYWSNYKEITQSKKPSSKDGSNIIFKKTQSWDTREVYTTENHANPYHCAGQIIEYGPSGHIEKGFYFVPSCEEVYLSKSDLEEIMKGMK